MNKNEIVEQLFRGKNFNDCISKMEPEHLRDDLKQEVILIVCGWDDEKIKGLHERKELEFYVARVIIQQIRSSTSPFFKKYRMSHQEFTEQEIAEENDIDVRAIREQIEDLAIGEIDKLYWYDAEMVRLYMKVGSFRAMEKQTKIPYTSCFKTVQKALQELRRRATEPAARPEPLFSRTELKTLRG